MRHIIKLIGVLKYIGHLMGMQSGQKTDRFKDMSIRYRSYDHIDASFANLSVM